MEDQAQQLYKEGSDFFKNGHFSAIARIAIPIAFAAFWYSIYGRRAGSTAHKFF